MASAATASAEVTAKSEKKAAKKVETKTEDSDSESSSSSSSSESEAAKAKKEIFLVDWEKPKLRESLNVINESELLQPQSMAQKQLFALWLAEHRRESVAPINAAIDNKLAKASPKARER